MTDDYTPTTEEVREQYWAASGDRRRGSSAWGEFDRWLAAHDAQKRAEWEAEQGGHVVPCARCGQRKVIASDAINSDIEVCGRCGTEIGLHELAEQRVPDGWFVFGSHAPYPWTGTLEFSTETDDAGMPLWERPVQDWPTDAQADAAAIAFHEFAVGDEFPLTRRDLGITRQAWKVALREAQNVKEDSDGKN